VDDGWDKASTDIILPDQELVVCYPPLEPIHYAGSPLLRGATKIAKNPLG
jgi:hypothetical protein